MAQWQSHNTAQCITMEIYDDADDAGDHDDDDDGDFPC